MLHEIECKFCNIAVGLNYISIRYNEKLIFLCYNKFFSRVL